MQVARALNCLRSYTYSGASIQHSLVTFLSLTSKQLRRNLCDSKPRSFTMTSSTGSPTIGLVFLSSGSVLSPPKTVIIVTAHSHYLINAPEATSRVLQESGAKLSKVSHIFITGNQWELCGGLIGTCLNIKSAGLQSAVKLHGPPIIKDVGNQMAKFSDTAAGMKLEYNSSMEFSDSIFHVSALSVNCLTSNAKSCCYLFKPKPLPAKLDMLKAVKMNFPVSMLKDGVTANRLKAGESVQLPDGRVIDGKELTIAPAKSKAILFIDCATPSIAVQLAKSDKLRQWISDTDCGIEMIVHLAELPILRLDEYRAVVDLFRDTTNSEAKHVVLDGRQELPALCGAHQCQLMLNTLDDRIFPLLYGHRFMDKQDSANLAATASSDADKTESVTAQSFPDNAISCATYQEYYLRPPMGFASSQCASTGDLAIAAALASVGSSKREPFTEAAMRDKMFEDNEIYITRQEFADKLADYRATNNPDRGLRSGATVVHRPYPWLQFLGTASSNPFKYRNVSAIMLHISEDSKLLLDCGEGTLFQLINFYGFDDCQAVLRSIKAICVSHMHLDHQSGILCLLRARHRAFESVGLTPSPCAFIGPHGFSRWLSFFTNINGNDGLSDVSALGDLVPFWSENICGISQHWQTAINSADSYDKFVKESLGLRKVEVVPVEHSTKVAFGFSIYGGGCDSKPWKIVYSGDTVPCASLVHSGADCDLLIHEATFQDGLESEAQSKMHSTVGQALAQSAAMRARHTILTHFSSRYTCIPPVVRPPAPDSRVGFAYDHTCVSLLDGEDLPKLAIVTGMLAYLFPKHQAELERRSYRYNARSNELENEADHAGVGSSSSTAVDAVQRRLGGGKRRRTQFGNDT